MGQLSAGKVMAMANQPTLYELSFWKRHSRYLRDVQPAGATSIQFNDHDVFQAENFTGNEIQTADTVLGRLVTVFLTQTFDSGSTTFTLLVPSVNLPPSKVANITTEGIATLHKFAIAKPPRGQTELYTVDKLDGMARFVEF
jgi:hypothetical protein